MPVQKTRQRAKVSRRDRPDSKQRPGRSVEDGQSKAGVDIAAVNEPGFHLLSRELRPITRFESFSASDHEDGSLLATIDTEEKQLQAIVDLYQVLKAQPKYKDLRDPVLKVAMPPVTVLKWILRKLGPLAEGNKWTVDTYRAGSKIRYRFVIYKAFYAYYLKPKEIYFPFDFLPALKRRDQPLHDLIIDVFALVSRNNNLPIWDEDGDYSEELKILRREKTPTGNSVLDIQVFNYQKGPAAQYLALLKTRRKVVNLSSTLKKLDAYKDDSDRKGDIKSWLRDGLYIAKTRADLRPWSYVPHHLQENPIGPFRQYKVVWSVHANDVIQLRAAGKMQKDAKSGDYYPVMFSSARPGERLKPLNTDRFQFPANFYWFLEHGWRILFTRHHKYFYKQAFASQETPAETLLQRIEVAELHATT